MANANGTEEHHHATQHDVVSILASSLHGQTNAIVAELQAMRHDLRWVFAVLVVALVLMAGLVGVGTIYRAGPVQVSTHPTTGRQP